MRRTVGDVESNRVFGSERLECFINCSGSGNNAVVTDFKV
jgi:hypothetical protein